MSSAHVIAPSDRELMRRLAIAGLFVFVFTAAFAKLERTYSQKFFDVTGRAQWIWAPHRMSDNIPVAFFAARDFDLPARRYYTRLKVLGDPEYTVYVNGNKIAGRLVTEEDRTLDTYDISHLVKTGRNRIVVAVRAPRGVGGVIAAIDLSPEVANWVVTNGEWKIYRAWTPALLVRDLPQLASAPVVIGEPPIGRWNYLTVAHRELDKPLAETLPPRETFEQIGYVPTVQTVSGVAVAGTERERATAFDFGRTSGRVQVTVAPKAGASQVVSLRYANERDELALVEWGLRPLVLAPGETVIATPESRDFRYVMVFGGKDVRAEVVK
ncbi:MAG TPA: hypothetical protein VF846_18480 [Thermoanaerobaculia bacterium]|jgi:hypothetical protein